VHGRLSALIEVTAGFHPELTGRENVYLNGTILGMKKKEIDERLEDIIEFSGIREFIDTPVKRYSSGMFSRLGFSVAAYVDPDVLLVDEVLSVGDIAFQSKCAKKMRELLSRGTTIVLVSHNMSLIQSMCPRVILLDKGGVLMEGGPEEVIRHYENIVLQQQEEEFKKEVKGADYKVKLNETSAVDITDVQLMNRDNDKKDKFSLGSDITIKVEYETVERIESPIFSLNIIRADGVLCCSSNTKNTGHDVESIEGKGAITIKLGKIALAANVYLVEVGIWDKDMMHPYVIYKKDVFRMEAGNTEDFANVVFLPSIKWNI